MIEFLKSQHNILNKCKGSYNVSYFVIMVCKIQFETVF